MLADFVVGFVSDVEDATPSVPVVDLTMPELTGMSSDEGKDTVGDSVKAAGGGQLQQQEFDAPTVLNRFVLGWDPRLLPLRSRPLACSAGCSGCLLDCLSHSGHIKRHMPFRYSCFCISYIFLPLPWWLFCLAVHAGGIAVQVPFGCTTRCVRIQNISG